MAYRLTSLHITKTNVLITLLSNSLQVMIIMFTVHNAEVCSVGVKCILEVHSVSVQCTV